MNKACETWLEKRRCLLRNFLWHKWTENLMITKVPNTISSGKILYRNLFFSYSFLAKTYQSHTQFYTPPLVHSGITMYKEYETKNNPVRSYRPARLPLTTCTSPLTITRIVNTHFYHYQYVDHIPTVPLKKIGSRSRWRTWNPRKMK
jgi:hypothetical protein